MFEKRRITSRMETRDKMALINYITQIQIDFGAVALLRWPLVYVLLGLGTIACLLSYRKLKP